jgi:hypothetical protein
MIELETPSVKKDPIEQALEIYQNKIISSKVYSGTPDGRLHAIEANSIRGILYVLGILNDEEDHIIVDRAGRKASKCQRGDKK